MGISRRRAAATLRAVFLSLATMIFACAAQAVAQNGVGSAYGTVLANDGTPISGATVTIANSKRSQKRLSGADGRFEFSNVPPGTYQVSAYAAGYTPLANTTMTIGTQSESLTLTLVRATTNSLTVIDSVRVGAGETVSTSSAPSVALSAQGAAAGGVTQISDMLWDQLATTPVLPLGGGSNATAAFALRGPDPTETLVDIDGHQMNNGSTGDFDLSLIDPAAMQDVQLVYGISPSSLAGPNTIGGAINILTLEPTTTPQTLLRAFGGSFGSFGETMQSTGTKGLFGYAVSLHQANSSGSVNQTVLDSASNTYQHVGGGSFGDSLLSKLRYQLGGKNGYGYLQLDFRSQTINKDESALLTTDTDGTFQSAAGTSLAARQANYGFDAQLPVGNAKTGDAPSTALSFSHLTTLDSQSVSGPLADSLPYLYNQRDALGDDWIEIDHRWNSGDLSLKYDVATEALTTDYVQGQIVAQLAGDQQTPSTQTFPLSQTQRYAVIRYNGDPTSHIHYSLATYFSNYSTFGSSIDPRAGLVWTPTGNTAVRASLGSTFQTPQTLRTGRAAARTASAGRRHRLRRQPESATRSRDGVRSRRRANLRAPRASVSSLARHVSNESPRALGPAQRGGRSGMRFGDALPGVLSGQCRRRHLSWHSSASGTRSGPAHSRARRLGC